jgi:hypothetical protein
MEIIPESAGGAISGHMIKGLTGLDLERSLVESSALNLGSVLTSPSKLILSMYYSLQNYYRNNRI